MVVVGGSIPLAPTNFSAQERLTENASREGIFPRPSTGWAFHSPSPSMPYHLVFFRWVNLSQACRMPPHKGLFLTDFA